MEKSTAIARYNVEPSRLNVYPVGITNPTIDFGTPNFSIIAIAFGSAASELAVVNVKRAGS